MLCAWYRFQYSGSLSIAFCCSGGVVNTFSQNLMLAARPQVCCLVRHLMASLTVCVSRARAGQASMQMPHSSQGVLYCRVVRDQRGIGHHCAQPHPRTVFCRQQQTITSDAPDTGCLCRMP